jgi:hypothetical protein
MTMVSSLVFLIGSAQLKKGQKSDASNDNLALSSF